MHASQAVFCQTEQSFSAVAVSLDLSLTAQQQLSGKSRTTGRPGVTGGLVVVPMKYMTPTKQKEEGNM